MKHSQTKSSSSKIMSYFPYTPESCGALINPRGERHTKKEFLDKRALIGFPTHAYSYKRLALLRLYHTCFFCMIPNAPCTRAPA